MEETVPNENLSELLAQLSAGTSEASGTPALADERLREILVDLAHRPLPVHSLHRLWTLGELSAQIALAYGASWFRQCFAGAEERQRLAMETNLRVALQLFHRLSYLRGAMTKLGQSASHFGPVVPREIAAVLDRLHCEAPPMHYSLVREVVENEFGKDPESLFASFERNAFAAASLGQVHRARLRTGEPVAVKIQYPGIARTIGADFRNLGALLFPLRLSPDWAYMQAQFDEVRRMLEQEVDYRQEAEATRRAATLFQPADDIVVPRVFDDYSSGRVLTTDFMPGRHLDAFLALQPSQEQRDRAGTLIYRAHFRMYYALMNYADPHPGNYLFLDDGRLALIDFGCIQHYGPEEREILRLSEELITVPDARAVTDILLELVCGIKPDDPSAPRYRDMMNRSKEWMMEPMRAQGPFDFGDEGHLRRGFAWFTSVMHDRTTRAHPMYVYYNRCVFGIKALLYRLAARVDVKALYDAESHPFTP